MTLIKNKAFIQLIEKYYKEKEKPYIGMGNPSGKILLIGCEKALDKSINLDNEILRHELELNIEHWYDILHNHNTKQDPFDPSLLIRGVPFDNFNPFNPLFFNLTAQRVKGKSGHTYYGLQRLINEIENNETTLFGNTFNNNTFSKCFLTEISVDTARSSNSVSFNIKNFKGTLRYNFLNSDEVKEFFETFKIIILYCGKKNKYVGKKGSREREWLIGLFGLTNDDIHNENGLEVYYNNEKSSSKIILCRHIAGGLSGKDIENIKNSI